MVPNIKVIRDLRAELDDITVPHQRVEAAQRWLRNGENTPGYQFEIKITQLRGIWVATLIYGFGGHSPTRSNILAEIDL